MSGRMRLACLLAVTGLGVAIHTPPAAARTADDGAEIDEPDPADPYELPRLRIDGGLGGMFGDGAGTFAMRAHVGLSAWHRIEQGSALRLTGGFAFGMDIADSQHSYVTAAPFAELGLAHVSPRTAEHGPRQATVFVRAEPVLLLGTLNEHALRIGGGVTLHGFPRLFPPFDHSGGGHTSSDSEDFEKVFMYTIGLPVVIAMNVRHVELTSDIGPDGHHQVGFLLGFGGQ